MIDAGVPTTVGEVLDPVWLTEALSDISDTDRIVAVETVGSSKTLAEKLRFAVVVERGGVTRSQPYCAKAHLDGSPGADIVPEARFYRDLAPRLDLRIPRVQYAQVDEAAGQAIVVMDDVVALGGRFLDAHTPYPLETARDTLAQLARLHAQTWGGELTADLGWLSPQLDWLANVVSVEALQALMADGRCADLPAELADAAKLRAALGRTATHEVTCVIHGDTQSGNVYLDALGRACWLDWQVVQPGSWAVDVSYHLATALDVETRRAHERDLLRHYLDELASHGAPAPPWDEAWDLYASSFAYGYFLWMITRISSREVVLIHVPRIAAALADHETFRRLGVT